METHRGRTQSQFLMNNNNVHSESMLCAVVGALYVMIYEKSRKTTVLFPHL